MKLHVRGLSRISMFTSSTTSLFQKIEKKFPSRTYKKSSKDLYPFVLRLTIAFLLIIVVLGGVAKLSCGLKPGVRNAHPGLSIDVSAFFYVNYSLRISFISPGERWLFQQLKKKKMFLAVFEMDHIKITW